MRHKTLASPLVLVLAACLAGGDPALAQRGDVPGARDYPGIGRFAGSVVTGYQVKDFDAARVQAAAFKEGRATAARSRLPANGSSAARSRRSEGRRHSLATARSTSAWQGTSSAQ